MALPGIKIIENVTSRIATSVNDTTAFLIATANWGPENTLGYYSSGAQASKDYKSGPLAINCNLFNEGAGGLLKTYRFVPNDAEYATATLASSDTSEIVLTGKYKGTYGNSIWYSIEEITSGNIRLIISDDYTYEVYDNLGAGFTSNTAIVTAINAASNLVTATSTGNTLVSVAAKTALSGGDNGTAIAIADVTSIINTYIDEDYKFLLVPEIDADASQGSIANYMVTRESLYKLYSIYITGIAADEAYATTVARTSVLTNGRMICIAPGTVVYNDVKYDGPYAASYYAGQLTTLPINKSATHEPFNLPIYVTYTSETNYTQNYTVGQITALRDLGFTVIGKIANYRGVVQAVTRINDNTHPYFEQVVVNEIDYVKQNVCNIFSPYIGEPNTEDKRTDMLAAGEAFLNTTVRNQTINGYEIEIIPEGATTVDVNMTILPTYPINYVNVTLNI